MHRHALLAEVEREWEVGLRLGVLAEEDGSLPGFMGTGAGVHSAPAALADPPAPLCCKPLSALPSIWREQRKHHHSHLEQPVACARP